jgi:uncharacterized protein YcbX
MTELRVAELWRYPVKSLAGERLEATELTVMGISGDRVVQVWDDRDRVLTARTHPGLLGLRATLGSDGEPLVNGLPWRAPETPSVERPAPRRDSSATTAPTASMSSPSWLPRTG